MEPSPSDIQKSLTPSADDNPALPAVPKKITPLKIGIGVAAIFVVLISGLLAMRMSSAPKSPPAHEAARDPKASRATGGKQASHVPTAAHATESARDPALQGEQPPPSAAERAHALPGKEDTAQPDEAAAQEAEGQAKKTEHDLAAAIDPHLGPTGADSLHDPKRAQAAGKDIVALGAASQGGPAVPLIRHVKPNDAELRDMIALATAPPKARSAPKDLWSGTMPTALKELRDAIASGARGSGHSIAALRRYNSENVDDARGHLLLAGFYLNRGWSLDALDQYNVAYQIDPSSRGCPEMLANLVGMVLRDQAGSAAAWSIERAYQKAAIPSIVQTLHAADLDAAAVARLKHLQARLTRAR